MKPYCRLFIAMGLLALSCLAWANPIVLLPMKPPFWLALQYYIIGNLLVGLFEGLLIVWTFKTRPRTTFPLMILANFFSALLGFAICKWLDLEGRDLILGEFPLYHVTRYICLVFLTLYLAALILEWPYCLIALGNTTKKWRKSLLAVLLTQTASYAILIPLYFFLEHDTALDFMINMKIERTLDFSKHPQARVYFFDEQRDQVSYTSLGAGHAFPHMAIGFKIFKGKSLHDYKMEVTRELSSFDRLDLREIVKKIEADVYPHRGIINDLRLSNHSDWQIAAIPRDELWDYRRRFVEWNPSRWHMYDDYWRTGRIQSFAARNDKTGAAFNFTLHRGLLRWSVGHITLLPGDQAVFDLNNQIVLFDLNTHQMALIARGTHPIVVLDQSDETTKTLKASPQLSLNLQGFLFLGVLQCGFIKLARKAREPFHGTALLSDFLRSQSSAGGQL